MVGGGKSHIESNPSPPEVLGGLKQNLVCTRAQGPHKRLSQTCLECLNVSCRGMGQQWPAAGTGDLAAADLRGAACEPHHRATDNTTHKLENNVPKKFLHCCKVPGPTPDSPTWGSSKGTENPPGIWLWRPVGFDYRTSTGLGKQALGIKKKKKKTKNVYVPGPRRKEQ